MGSGQLLALGLSSSRVDDEEESSGAVLIIMKLGNSGISSSKVEGQSDYKTFKLMPKKRVTAS